MSQPTAFTWKYILRIAAEHKKEFIFANIYSILDTIIALPVPLILPSLINEVLLHQPGFFTKAIAYFAPTILVTPLLILAIAFSLVITLRLVDQISGFIALHARIK